MRLDDALQHLLLQLEADGRSVHTRAQYERTIRLLGAWLASERRSDDLDAITPQTLALFLNSPGVRVSAHGGGPKTTITVNGTRTSLRVAFRWWHEAGLATTNAARLVRRAICQPPPPKALSDAEVERLEAALVLARGPVARRDHALIGLMLSTGIRFGSALALDVEDIDIANGEILLRCTKGDRSQRVFMSRDLRDHLIGYLARRPKRGALFRGPRGERLGMRCAQKRVTHWLGVAGVEHAATAHALRHTFATRLLRRTGDLFLVKQALGHRSILSTVVYLDLSDERLRAAMLR